MLLAGVSRRRRHQPPNHPSSFTLHLVFLLPRSLSPTEYLARPANSFWEWRENGEVVAWPDGTTIAFRPQLVFVLERLAPGGLPPLSSVILLLAACRESWPIASSQFVTLCSTLASSESAALPPWLMDLPQRLDEI